MVSFCKLIHLLISRRRLVDLKLINVDMLKKLRFRFIYASCVLSLKTIDVKAHLELDCLLSKYNKQQSSFSSKQRFRRHLLDESWSIRLKVER